MTTRIIITLSMPVEFYKNSSFVLAPLSTASTAVVVRASSSSNLDVCPSPPSLYPWIIHSSSKVASQRIQKEKSTHLVLSRHVFVHEYTCIRNTQNNMTTSLCGDINCNDSDCCDCCHHLAHTDGRCELSNKG
jgi:uncharacterized heparinase superfamily protein